MRLSEIKRTTEPAAIPAAAQRMPGSISERWGKRTTLTEVIFAREKVAYGASIYINPKNRSITHLRPAQELSLPIKTDIMKVVTGSTR